MININKFNNLADYLDGGNMLYDECRVSQIGPSANMDIRYDTPTILSFNRVVSATQLRQDEVAMVVKDLTDGKIKYIPQKYFNASKLDTTRYELKPFIRYRGEGTKQLMIYKNAANSIKWGRNEYYKLILDTTSAGTIKLTVTLNGTARTLLYAWDTGASLDTVATGLNNSLSISHRMSSKDGQTGIYVAHLSGEDFIRISVGTNSASTLSVVEGTDTTPGVYQLIDLSATARYGGTALSSVHHGWANTSLLSMFSGDSSITSALRSAYGVSSTGLINAALCYSVPRPYMNNGTIELRSTDMGDRCGANLSRYSTWASTNTSNASKTFSHIFNSSGPINSNTFSAIPSGTDVTGSAASNGVKAYYDYMSGDYSTYLRYRMADPDSSSGVCSFSKNNGQAVTAVLGQIETPDFDGSWVPAFPAAQKCYSVSDPDLGRCGMPSAHEIVLLYRDTGANNTFRIINTALGKIGGTAYTNQTYCCSSVEYNSHNDWNYSRNTGTLGIIEKYFPITVRPTLVYSF